MSGLELTERLAPASGRSAAGAYCWFAPVVLIGSGGLALAVGALVYTVDRHFSLIAPVVPPGSLATGALFGVLGQWLPSFVHPFAFCLFTAAVHTSGARAPYWPCVAWWGVNVIFELGQARGVDAAIATVLQDALGQTWLSRPLSEYLVRGTFDVADLAAATAGAIAAACVLRMINRSGVRP